MRVKIPWSAETREGRFPLNEWEVDPERTALVVVDLQRGYIEPDMGVGPTLREYPEIYQYYYPRVAELVLPNVVKLIGFFRERGLEVIFTRQGFTATDGRDLPPWNWRRGQLGRPEARLFWTGSPEAELVPELAQPDDLIVEKNLIGTVRNHRTRQVP